MPSCRKERRKETRKSFKRFKFWDSLICGSGTCSYDLAKGRTNEIFKTASKNVLSQLFACCKSTPQHYTENEKYLFALYKEGLILSAHIFIRDEKTKRSDKFQESSAFILTLYEHPILNICLGFSDWELRQNCKILKYRKLPSYYEYSETCPIRAGIDRVLLGNPENNDQEYEPKINGIPLSLWSDIYEPIVRLMMLINPRKGRRSTLTKRRVNHIRSAIGHPNIGDFERNAFNVMGPPLPGRIGQHHRNLMAIISFRIGELGERSRMRRNQEDHVIQEMRNPNQNRSRTTQARPMSLSSTTDPLQPLWHQQVNDDFLTPADNQPANYGPVIIPAIAPANNGPANNGAANFGAANIEQVNIAPANIGQANIGPANIGPANNGPAVLRPVDIGPDNMMPEYPNIRRIPVRPANVGPVLNIRPPNPRPEHNGVFRPNFRPSVIPFGIRPDANGFYRLPFRENPINLIPNIMPQVNLVQQNVGPANIGPANMGPANIGPANMGPGNIGPANMGQANIGLGPIIVDFADEAFSDDDADSESTISTDGEREYQDYLASFHHNDDDTDDYRNYINIQYRA